MADPPRQPDWDRLFEIAEGQGGHFTTQQAGSAGYSPQLLRHHVRRGRVERMRRGIYRLVHFPTTEHEELVRAWLWTEREGVISHQSALAALELSDVLPAQIHVSLPSGWRKRRLRVPAGLVLHHGDVPPDERTWFGGVPITNARRSLNDCARAAISPELLEQAAREALYRGLVHRNELPDVEVALAPFGGIPS